MAGKRLTWIFELMDRVSAPAKAAARALGSVADATKKTADATEKASRHSESLQTRLESTLRLGERAFHLAEGLAEIGKSAAEAAIDAASFKETTTLSLTTVFGSADRAQKVLKDTVALAAHLPIQTEEAINATTRLALAGFDDRYLAPLVTAAADVKALNQGRSEAMEAFLRQLTDIKSVGLSDRHLMYLSMETHLPEDKILANISQLTGLKGTEKQIKEYISKGMVDRNTAINAVLKTLQQVEGGQIGGLSNRLAGTVSGLMSTLKSRKLELLMDLDASPGYATFREFLGNLTTLLDPSGMFGKKVSSKVAKTFNAVFGGALGDFTGKDGLFNLSNTLDKVLRGAEMVGVGFRAGAGFIRNFAEELLDAAGIGGDLFGPDGSLDEKKVKTIVDRFSQLGKELADVAAKIGAIIDQVSGISSGGGALAEATGTQVYKSYGLPGLFTVDTDNEGGLGASFFKGPLQSPFTHQGDAHTGTYASDDTINQSIGGNVSRAASRMGSGANGGGDQTINVTVNAPGATREDADHIGRVTEEGVKKTAAFLSYGYSN